MMPLVFVYLQPQLEHLQLTTTKPLQLPMQTELFTDFKKTKKAYFRNKLLTELTTFKFLELSYLEGDKNKIQFPGISHDLRLPKDGKNAPSTIGAHRSLSENGQNTKENMAWSL